MKMAVIGAGAYGRAIHSVAAKVGPTTLLGRSAGVGVETDWKIGADGVELIALAAPAQQTRAVLRRMKDLSPRAPLIPSCCATRPQPHQ